MQFINQTIHPCLVIISAQISIWNSDFSSTAPVNDLQIFQKTDVYFRYVPITNTDPILYKNNDQYRLPI